jgi:DNA-binding transcriptional MerR regulator
MAYTVKQVSDLAGVSIRTLHYYDEIGLLKPASHGENGYRYYDEQALLRLQQILFFRELDFSLNEIKTIMDQSDFDLLHALQAHRQSLEHQTARLSRLMSTIDKTILHLKGQVEMSTPELFEGFDDETQKRYEQEASRRWGDQHVKESRRRWNNYSAQQKAQIMAEGKTIYLDLLNYIGQDPASAQVQQVIARWHQHLRHFYEPSKEILLGLAQGYSQDPDFRAFFERMHPDLPEFLRPAIERYCQNMAVTN